VHLHTCALDGVYVEAEAGETQRFVAAPPPSHADLYALVARVALRVTWLRKRGYAKDDEHASNDTPDRTFAGVLARLATQRGSVENLKNDTGESDGPAEPAAPLRDEAVTRHGFNLRTRTRDPAVHRHHAMRRHLRCDTADRPASRELRGRSALSGTVSSSGACRDRSPTDRRARRPA
jgi:hypothetical protein